MADAVAEFITEMKKKQIYTHVIFFNLQQIKSANLGLHKEITLHCATIFPTFFYLKFQNCITFLQQWTIYGLNALTRDHVNNFWDTSTPVHQTKVW